MLNVVVRNTSNITANKSQRFFRLVTAEVEPNNGPMTKHEVHSSGVIPDTLIPVRDLSCIRG